VNQFKVVTQVNGNTSTTIVNADSIHAGDGVTLLLGDGGGEIIATYPHSTLISCEKLTAIAPEGLMLKSRGHI
jgi:hypothetical protein